MSVRKYGFNEAKQRAQEIAKQNEENILMRLLMIGETCVNHARTITKGHSTGGYDDQTGVLRSSIGYAIFNNGEKVFESGFAYTPPTTPEDAKRIKKTGEECGREAITNIGRTLPQSGFVLLIVAGANYAQYVEDKGYNVLHLTKIELERLINELKNKLYGKYNEVRKDRSI